MKRLLICLGLCLLTSSKVQAETFPYESYDAMSEEDKKLYDAALDIVDKLPDSDTDSTPTKLPKKEPADGINLSSYGNWKNIHNGQTDKDALATGTVVWQEIRSWGFTEEATAGLMANMIRESGINPTATQNGIPWEGNGSTKGVLDRSYPNAPRTSQAGAIGLIQWDYGRRQKSCAVAYAMYNDATKWNQLDVQLKTIAFEMAGWDEKAWEHLDKGGGTNYTGGFKPSEVKDGEAFCEEVRAHYERGGVANEGKQYVKTLVKQYSGLEPKSIEGNSVSSPETLETVEKITEWMLEGMPTEFALKDDQAEIEFKSQEDLGFNDVYSLASIGENINIKDRATMLDKARRFIVLLGLIVMSYASIIFIAMIFDRVNVFIDISLVKLLTFNSVNYNPNCDDEIEQKASSYISTKKLIFSIVIAFIVGCFIVSGGIFSRMSQFVWWLSEKFLL